MDRTIEALVRLNQRAEHLNDALISETFVDAGPLFSLLSTRRNQVAYGRRGTGKTHALRYLALWARESKAEVAVYIDMRSIGSSEGLYADPTLPIADRGTRLLVDVLASLHEELRRLTVDPMCPMLAPLLDPFGESITQVRVSGPTEWETVDEEGMTRGRRAQAGIGLSITGPDLNLELAASKSEAMRRSARTLERGVAEHVVHFGSVQRAIRDIVGALPNQRLWILLDEWSSIPRILQPILADLIKRALFPVQGVTVKICAVEDRASFLAHGVDGRMLGIELGADAAVDVNFDDFMIFDNNRGAARLFFMKLLYKHILPVFSEEGWPNPPTSPEAFVKTAFTRNAVFDEFVRATEGVPRDAIDIATEAASSTKEAKISTNSLRSGARKVYSRTKARNLSLDQAALLDWIINEVIGNRRARAFLLREGEGSRHDLITNLYDARVLHVVKRGIAAADRPGEKFDVYQLDYGCYVELAATSKAPRALLGLSPDETGTIQWYEVPPDDYRSIRRAVLDLSKFEAREV